MLDEENFEILQPMFPYSDPRWGQEFGTKAIEGNRAVKGECCTYSHGEFANVPVHTGARRGLQNRSRFQRIPAWISAMCLSIPV